MEEYNEREMARMKKLIILCVILMVASMVPMAAAINVDGHKDSGEWDENWAYNQTQGGGYVTPALFGDLLVIRQGAFGYPSALWSDVDPEDDSGRYYNESMVATGFTNPSGYDIKSISVHLDTSTGILYGLCEVYGMPGDLDGNNDIATVELNNGDTVGDAGPAGSGIGENEIWEIRATQGAESVYVKINNNNWTVYDSIALTYADVNAKFASTGVNPCYEISISGMGTYFDLDFGADPIMIEVRAGGLSDGPGEDLATAFVYLPDPSIDIEKSTNGVDADFPVGPVVDMGDPITWEYNITNTGVDPLINIVVNDNKVGNIVLPKTTLEPGESMIATNLSTATTYGQYSNIADVIGDFVGIPVYDEDPSHYYVYEPSPAIDIEKHTNGYDADYPKGPKLAMNAMVTWTYIVTNTGDVTLTNIVVTDDKLAGTISLGTTILAPGASTTGTATGTVTDYGQYENEATVTGDYNAITVSDMDPSHYYCLPPTDVSALTPAGLMGLIGILGIMGIVGVKRRE